MSAALGALALRMRTLQVEQADQFRLLADENRINIRLIPPARGRIFDPACLEAFLSQLDRVTRIQQILGDQPHKLSNES